MRLTSERCSRCSILRLMVAMLIPVRCASVFWLGQQMLLSSAWSAKTTSNQRASASSVGACIAHAICLNMIIYCLARHYRLRQNLPILDASLADRHLVLYYSNNIRH